MARDPNLWPFDTYSPFNLPIGSGVQYEAVGAAKTDRLRNNGWPVYINCDTYSVPVYQATTSDPLVTVTGPSYSQIPGRPTTVQIRIPAGASAAAGSDSNMAIIQPDGRLFDVWTLTWEVMNVSMTCGRFNYTLNTATGFGPQAGIRAAGSNTMGGLIRRWEVDPAHPNYTDGVIRHAIASAVDGTNMLLYTGGNTWETSPGVPGNGTMWDNNGYGTEKGYTWPATEQDYGSGAGWYGGPLPMGTFFAIPKSVNVAGLGLTSGALKIAKALQDYGGYILDNAYSCGPTFYAEYDCRSTAWLASAYDTTSLNTIRSNLRVVTNNSPSTINGGGTPLVALAPQIGSGGTPPPSTRPDETNTGYLPTGQTLTAYTGPMTITTAQTITGKTITGSLIISGVAVTISRSKLVMTAGGTAIGVTTTNGGSLTIVDTEVDGTANNAATTTGIDGVNVTVTRCNVHHCVWGVRVRTNCVVETSYIHDLKLNAGSDPVGVAGFGGNNAITIRNNSILAAGADATAAIYLVTTTGGASNDISVTGNYVSGGHSNAYFGNWRTGMADTGNITNLVITGNTFLGDNTDYVANGNKAIYPIDGHTTITSWATNVNSTGATIAQPANTSGSGGGGGGGGGTTLSTGVATVVSGGPVIKLNSTSALVSGSPFTTMIWHKPAIGTEYHGILGAMQPSDPWTTGAAGSDGWGLHTVQLGLHNFYHNSFYGNEPGPDTALNLLTVNQWAHIAAIVRPGSNAMTIDLFVNGGFVQTLSDNGPAWPTGLQPLIGSIDGIDPNATGGFACWRVWNAALTQAEIAAEMNSLTAVKASAIIDIDFTSASATNRGSGGAWSQQASIGTWSFSSEGVIPSSGGGGTEPPPVVPSFTFTDNFNRALSTSTLGAPWVTSGGNWGVASGGSAASGVAYAVTGDPSYATVDTGQVDHSIAVKVNNAKDDCQSIIVRYVNTSNYVYMTPATAYGTWNINKMVAGTPTYVGNMGLAGYNSRISLEAKGTVFTATVADPVAGLITRTYTIADAALQTGTKAGFRWGTTLPPSVPQGPTALALSATSIKFDWTASTGSPAPARYEVHRNGSATVLATVTAPAVTYTDTTCVANTTYTYQVVAVTSGNIASAYSAVATATTPSAGSGGGGGGSRDGFYWPFDSNSPWNLPVGNNATLEATNAAKTSTLRNSPATPWLNCESYSHPLYKATASDPNVFMTDVNDGSRSRSVRIPAGAQVAPGEDAHLHVLQPNGWEVVEMWMVNRSNNTAGRIEHSDLYSDGLGPNGGTRAYGGSAIGGLIRTADVVPGSPGYTDGVIKHAIAIAVPGSMMLAGGGFGYVWPATEQDGAWASTYGGNLPMGQYFVIPKTTNINGLGLTASGLKVAKALQDYGGYITDTSGSFSFYLEPSAVGSTFFTQILNSPAWNAADIGILRSQLVCVTNNSNTNRNGGGTRPIALAPGIGESLSLDGEVLPTTSNTGYVHTGVTLTPYTGPMTITTANTVIDSKTIPAGLVINAANVTVKRSLVMGESTNAIEFGSSGSGLIEDVEITCTPSAQYDRSITRYNANTAQVTIRRVYAHGGIRGVDFTGGNHIRMEDCYMAFNYNPGEGERSHASAARLAGSVHHLDLYNCVFGVGANSWSSGLLATYPENGANHDITIQGGLWIIQADNDYSYGIAAGTDPGYPANYNYSVHDLYVSTEYYSEGCQGGILQQWSELIGTNSYGNIRKWKPGSAEHGQLFTSPTS